MLLGHLAMAPHALAVVVEDELRAESLGHGAFGLAVVAQHFLQAVLGLGVAGPESRSGGGGGEDVRHAVFVAQDLDLLGAFLGAPSAGCKMPSAMAVFSQASFS